MEELLDGLCNELDAYEFREAAEDGAEGSWSRERRADKSSEEATRAQQLTADLVKYCHRLLEELEERLAEAIQQGASKYDLRTVMCGSACGSSKAGSPLPQDEL